MKRTGIYALITLVVANFQLFAQKNKEAGYYFENIKQIKSTPVVSQGETGTCWSFATTSFLESELLRMGKEEINISELFFVRCAYIEKANHYIRLQGTSNFGQGGQAHDVMNMIRKYGAVPLSVYSGLICSQTEYNHEQMVAVLKGMLDGVLKRRKEIYPIWQDAFKALLDVYIGKEPTAFDYQGKSYTPLIFSKEVMGINPDDYVELTSYTHHPYEEQIDLEIPDNWSHDEYYNISPDDLVSVIENAIKKGYTVVWDGDVSEKSFVHQKGLAIVPEKEEEMSSIPDKIIPEMKITPALRQETFDLQSTSDDHLMHITGIAKDQNGTRYFLTKNSWGAESNEYGGFLYLSEAYVRLKTVAIMVHKDAMTEEVRKKINH